MSQHQLKYLEINHPVYKWSYTHSQIHFVCFSI